MTRARWVDKYMPEHYPIFYLRTDDPLLTEQLGSKPKFWFRFQGDEDDWLFKYGRANTGEHWAEKVAAEVARLIQLPAARVELADFQGKRGTASLNFVRRAAGEDLVHGDEVLAGHVIGYERDKVFRHSSHSIHNIVTAVGMIFTDEAARHRQLTTLAGFVVLDALIGNTDRHHQNWGVLRRVNADGRVEQEIAPSFDHASSLGRNESDNSLRRRLDANTVLAYARRGRGGIFWRSTDPKAANPLELAERATQRWPQYFSPWLQQLVALDEAAFFGIVSRVPNDWMSATQKEFCVRFLSATCSELKKLLR